MRIQIKGKSFQLELSNGFLKIQEFYKNRKRWINFPVNLIEWVSGVLKGCSKLLEFDYSRRVGSLWWKIESGCNQWGWFLKFSVEIKGVWYSIVVPAINGANPWSNFINAFLQVAQEAAKKPKFALDRDCQNVCVDSSAMFMGESMFLCNDSVLKVEVDALLSMENMHIDFGHCELKSKVQIISHEATCALSKGPFRTDFVSNENVSSSLLESVCLNGVANEDVACSNGDGDEINVVSAGKTKRSVCVDGNEVFACSNGIGKVKPGVSVGDVSYGSDLCLISNMSDASSGSTFQWPKKKNQCQLLQHLGFNLNMDKRSPPQSQILQHLGFHEKSDKRNGVHMAKKYNKKYPNG